MHLTNCCTYKNFFKQFSILLSLILLSSCSYFLPHRITVQQGNIIEQEKVNQLKPGMRKDQVQFLLGTPMLMDPYHPDRWDYIYTIKRGHEDMEKNRLSLYFKEDELINIIGKFRPGEKVKNKRKKNEIITVPMTDIDVDDGKPWYSWILWWKDYDNIVKEPEEDAGEPEPNQVNESSTLIDKNKTN